MADRPRRERKQPERLTYSRAAEEVEHQGEASEEVSEEVSEEEEEEERPVKHARRAGKEPMAAEDEDMSGSEEEEGSEGEAEEAAAAGPSRRGAAAARKKAAPLPPLEPMSRADLLSALHACPTLVDCIVKPDGLRTVTLLARDVASLATALCAGTEEMSDAWRVLALQHDEAFSGTAEQALVVVREAVAADPARLQRCTKTAAKSEYRLGEKDLEGLSYVTRHNPIFWSAAPTKLYSVLDCLAIAHRKYGDLERIEAAKAKGRAAGQKAKATRDEKKGGRKEEIEAALKKAGLSVDLHMHDKQVTRYIKSGGGTAKELAAAIKKQEDAPMQRAKRLEQLRKRLVAEGLYGELTAPAAIAFVNGSSKDNLRAVVAAVREAKEKREAEQARREELEALLAKAGVQPHRYYPTLAESISAWRYRNDALDAFLRSGEGSAKALAKAIQEQQAEAAAADEEAQERMAACEARRSRVKALLAEAGLPADFYFSGISAISKYIRSGKGSEEEVVAAAREAQQAQQASQARHARVEALLAEAGLPADFYHHSLGVSAIHSYIYSGEGSEEEVLAAAREAQQAEQARDAQREQRRARVVELLAAEELEAYIEAAYDFIHYNYDNEASVVAAARRQGDQEAAAIAVRDRRTAVRQLLQANGIPAYYSSLLSSIAYYVETGEGSEAAVLAVAKKRHDRDVAKYPTIAAAEAAAAAAGADAEDSE